MRTVHETEALRPSDPVPKSMQPAGKSKVKIIIKTPQSQAHGDEDLDDSATPEEHADYFTHLSPDVFDEEELSYVKGGSVDKLYRKCFCELKWAEDIGKTLTKECKEWEEAYHKEWLEKEVLLSQVIQSEVDWHERRQAILSGTADVQIGSSSSTKEPPVVKMEEDKPEEEDADDETREASPSPAVNGAEKKRKATASPV